MGNPLWYNDPKNGISELGGSGKATSTINFVEAKIYYQDKSILLVGYADDISDISKKGGGFKFSPQMVSLRFYNDSQVAFEKFLVKYLPLRLKDQVCSFKLFLGQMPESNLETFDSFITDHPDKIGSDDPMFKLLDANIFSKNQVTVISSPEHLKDGLTVPEEKKGAYKPNGFAAQIEKEKLAEKWEFIGRIMVFPEADRQNLSLFDVVKTLPQIYQDPKDLDVALKIIEAILKS